MSDVTTREGSGATLPSMPAKSASPEDWREYHRALFEAGKLAPPEPNNL